MQTAAMGRVISNRVGASLCPDTVRCAENILLKMEIMGREYCSLISEGAGQNPHLLIYKALVVLEWKIKMAKDV